VSRTEHDLKVEIGGVLYFVQVEVEWKKVDDSFDGHLYGRPHTFEAHHFEPAEYEVVSITDETGEEVDEDDVPRLSKAIKSEVDDLEYDGY